MRETAGDGSTVVDHFIEREEGCGRETKSDLGERVADETNIDRGLVVRYL